MTEIFMPTALDLARATFRYIDSTGFSRNPFTGAVRTVALGGDRLGCKLDTTIVGDQRSASGLADRARILQFIMRLQGQQNRAYIFDPGYRQRGSFPSAELIANNEFTNGAAGWTSGGHWNIGVVDGSLRAKRNQSGTAGPFAALSAAIAVTQYAPYAMRFASVLGAGLDPTTFQVRIDDAASGATGVVQAWAGLRTQVYAAPASTLRPQFAQINPATIIAGSFLDILYTSMSRCILADNSPNALVQSDNITTTWSNGRTTDSANTTTNFDGTSTADSLIEDSSVSQTHYIQQVVTKSAVTEDWCGVAILKANTRTQAAVQIGEAGTNFARVIVDLTNGNILTAAAAAGTVTNPRAFVRDMGNGWYAIWMLATVPSTVTTTNGILIGIAVSNSTSYTGDGASGIYVGRGGYAASTQPFFPSLTTTPSAPSGTAQFGNSLNLKGLPVSTSGLLLAGDQVEIITSFGSELKIVREQLDSDSGGLGTLSFAPRLRGTVSDNAAVITCRPMGRFVYMPDTTEWMTDPGIFTSTSFDFEEAVG